VAGHIDIGTSVQINHHAMMINIMERRLHIFQYWKRGSVRKFLKQTRDTTNFFFAKPILVGRWLDSL
jgi:hypothetical protein